MEMNNILKSKIKLCFILLSVVLIALSGIFFVKYINEKNYSKRDKFITAIDINEIKVKKNIDVSNINDDDKSYFYVKKDNMNIIKLIGVRGKFGFTEDNYYANNFSYTNLYLWGDEDNILNKNLKITASNSQGNVIDIVDGFKIKKEGHAPEPSARENTTSTAVEQLNIKLSAEGTWKLSVYIDNNLIGEINIDVKKENADDFNKNIVRPSPL